MNIYEQKEAVKALGRKYIFIGAVTLQISSIALMLIDGVLKL